MHHAGTVQAARELAAQGATASEVARQLGIPRSTVRDWRAGAVPHSAAPGRKHERPIVLGGWQEVLADRWPAELLRGLIHADGCRFQNTGRNWSWPRYAFANHSDDIRAIFCRTCDGMRIHWTASGGRTIYVSRKADVATLDRYIGPKH